MKTIGAYEPLTPMQTTGSGSARWCIAQKDGGRFFLKEFLSPVYPGEGGDPALREKRLERCLRFEEKKRRLYAALSCVIGDTLTPSADFFRFGNRYYAVSEEIPGPRLTIESPLDLSVKEKREILLSVALCLQRLHMQGIVHADLKPEHVLLRRGAPGWEVRLIDLDSGFLLEEPPAAGSDTEGDPVYLAPETFLRMTGQDAPLGTAADTFAFGAMICRLWTGSLPGLPEGCSYLYEAALTGAPVRLPPELPLPYRAAVLRALSADPALRPDDGELVRLFSRIPDEERFQRPPFSGEALNGLSRFMKKD